MPYDGIILSHQYEVLIHNAMWMNLKNAILRKRSQTQNDSTYIKYPDQADSLREKIDQWFPGTEKRNRELLLIRRRDLYEGMKLLELDSDNDNVLPCGYEIIELNPLKGKFCSM